MEIEHIALSDITPYEKNAKTHPKKQVDLLAENIKRFGFTTPCLVDKDNNLIAGHGRLEAVKTLGWTDVPCVRMEKLTEDEVKALRLADNKLAEMSEWDMALVTDELKELDDELLNLTGFDKDLIIEADEADDEVPDVPEEPQSKLGDLYELGNHRVLCGDSTKIEDVERLMDGKKADMVFTSPPYNAGKSEALSGNTHTTDNKYQDGYSDDKPQEEWGELIRKTLGAVMPYSEYQFYNVQMLAGNKVAFLKLLGDFANQIVDLAIWNKGHSQPAMAENVMNSSFEFIIVFSGKTNPNRAIKMGNFRGTVSNVFDVPPQKRNEFSKVHAATFPVELPTKILTAMTYEGAKIIDNFAGTGTTLIASEKTGRVCYGMEIDPRYISVILDRWSDYTGKDPILKETADPSDQRKGLAWSVIKSSNLSGSL
jgi:DNA modification methylase